MQHDTPVVAFIGRVKIVDKKESPSAYKRVKTWPVTDLKVVDCHGDSPELDFKFDKQLFKWIVVNVAEKRSFILNLFRVSG